MKSEVHRAVIPCHRSRRSVIVRELSHGPVIAHLIHHEPSRQFATEGRIRPLQLFRARLGRRVSPLAPAGAWHHRFGAPQRPSPSSLPTDARFDRAVRPRRRFRAAVSPPPSGVVPVVATTTVGRRSRPSMRLRSHLGHPRVAPFRRFRRPSVRSIVIASNRASNSLLRLAPTNRRGMNGMDAGRATSRVESSRSSRARPPPMRPVFGSFRFVSFRFVSVRSFVRGTSSRSRSRRKVLVVCGTSWCVTHH